MIKIKLGEIGKILDGMKVLIEKDLPIKTAYKLSKLLKILVGENETYELQRLKLISKYGIKDNNGELKTNDDGTIGIDTKHIERFKLEFKELNDIDIEIIFNPLKLDELENISLSVKTLYVLDNFITE
jgi:hypothetical protein